MKKFSFFDVVHVASLLGAWFILFMLLSCGSRQKEVSKQRSRIENFSDIDADTSSSAKATVADFKSESSNEDCQEETYEYDGDPGDTLSVKKFGANGKLLSETRLSGKGKAKIIKTHKQVQQAQSSLHSESSENASSSHIKKKETSVTETSDYHKKVKASGFTFWTWFWIILITIILLVLWYLNKRFKWFSML
jgi:preprotein translocase subunit SecG